jgi:hypothetical protein
MNIQAATSTPTSTDDETPEYPLPSPTNPLSPGRMTINPDDDPGNDELPDNEGRHPLDADDDTGIDPDRVREEPDNAVLDDKIDPR